MPIFVCPCLSLAVGLGPVFIKARDRIWGSVEESGDKLPGHLGACPMPPWEEGSE